MDRSKGFFLFRVITIVLSVSMIPFLFGRAEAFRFDTDVPIDQVIAAVQNPNVDAKQKASDVKHLGKYFPITEKGKARQGLAPLEAAQKAIPVLLPLLNGDDPTLLFNTIETLSHIVQNYPKEFYTEIRPPIERLTNSPYPKVAKKAITALTNMEFAFKQASK